MGKVQMVRPSNMRDEEGCCGGPIKSGGHDHSHNHSSHGSHDHSHSHSDHSAGGDCCGDGATKKKKAKKTKKAKDSDDEAEDMGHGHHDHDHDHDADDDVTETEVKPKRKAKQADAGGYNWTAIGILMLFLIPVVLTGILHVMDYLYPENAKARVVRERVIRCYEAANPSKVDEVDKFVERYKGREHVLFAQLRTKYEKYPECQY